MQVDTIPQPDWIERKTAQMLNAAKRSQFFESIIEDAKWYQSEYGYAWDVALRKSCGYWLDWDLFGK